MSVPEYDIIIIGGGPAGMTAGLYASRAELKTLLVEKMIMGGQMMTATLVENWPGYPGGIDGPELMMRFQEHCVEFGLETMTGEIEKIEDLGKQKRLIIDGKEYLSKTVIIATGANPRKLGLAGEEALVGRGVSYCATCDGAFFRNVPIAVIGAGDTAAEEAVFLTRFASKVYMVHRRDKMRTTKILQNRVFANEKIEMVWDSVVEGFDSDNTGLTGIKIVNVKTGEQRQLDAVGMFVAIGVSPVSKFLDGIVALDKSGYIKAGENTHTSAAGIYAAGDCRTNILKQVSTAVGDGAVAATQAEKYISEM